MTLNRLSRANLRLSRARAANLYRLSRPNIRRARPETNLYRLSRRSAG